MVTFKVWLAKDTLLYLPIYALADLGVLERVAKTIGFQGEVRIEIQTSPNEGDSGAITHMLSQADIGHEEDVHVAIGDPIDVYRADEKGAHSALLGAFIKRPPFWLIGRKVADDISLKHTYVYYDDDFSTGAFLGRRYAAAADEQHRVRCPMGSEFQYLESEDITGRVRVLTADIVGLVKVRELSPDIGIIDRAKDHKDFQEFLTTGIITHRKYLSNHSRSLSVFLEAVRFSCVLLRSAEGSAAALIRQAIVRGTESKTAITKIDSEESYSIEKLSTQVARQIFDDTVYSDTLSITPQEWKRAVDVRTWVSEEAHLHARRLFSKIYKPQFANLLTAAWLVETFRDYGRFVIERRRARSGVWVGLSSLILTMLALPLFFMYSGADTPLSIRGVYIASAVVIIGSICWLTAAIVRSKSGIFLWAEMFLARDRSLSDELLRALFVIVTLGLSVPVAFLFGVAIPAYVWVVYGAIEFGTVAYCLWMLRRRRHA